MKYFIDTEFLEGDVPIKIFGLNIPKWLVKPNNTIQPISVGLVSEYNREYYAISKDFNLKEAWNRYDIVKKNMFQTNYSKYEEKVYWIRDNVLKPIFIELQEKQLLELGTNLVEFCYKDLKTLINKYGKTNKQIAEEIKEFVGTKETIGNWDEIKDKMNTQFYGYGQDNCFVFINFLKIYG